MQPASQTIIAFCRAAAIALTVGSGISAAPSNVEQTVIAWSGDTRTGGGLFGTVDPPTINDNGAVAFISSSGSGAIWQGTNRNALRLVAVKGGAAPTGLFDSFSSVIQDNAGRVLFDGQLQTGPGGITAANNEGYWAETTPGTLVEIAREGLPAPGAAGVAFVAPFGTDSARFGNNGLVLVRGDLSSGIDEVVLAGQPGAMQLVARSGQQPPGLGSGLGWRTFDVIAATGAGRFLFLADYWQNSNQQFKGEGAWSDRGGSLAAVFIDQVVRGAPAQYQVQGPSNRDIGVNGAGKVVIRQLLTNPAALVDSGHALFSETRGALQYETGYPEVAAGLSVIGYGNGTSSPLINAQDRIAFSSDLFGKGVTEQNDSALWIGTGTQYTLVARAGSQAPGVSVGITFGSVVGNYGSESAPSLGSGGHLVLRALLVGGEVPGTANLGLWMTDRAGRLRLMARKGDTIVVAPGQTRTFNDFDLVTGSGGDDGRPRCVNVEGHLAFKASFTSGDSAIVIARLTDDPVTPADEPPKLSLNHVGGDIAVLTWSTDSGNCVLQVTSNPGTAAWQDLTDPPLVTGNLRTLQLSTTQSARFYRIRCP